MKYIKIGLFVAILATIFMEVPYCLYEIIRFFAMIVFAVHAYNCFKSKRYVSMVMSIALVIVFQPYVKITLDRVWWIVIDILSVMYMAGILINDFRSEKNVCN